MVLIIILGFYQGRKIKTGSNFAITGRKLPGWVAALSERATGESSWALLGLPGAAYATGLIEIWTAVGYVFGIEKIYEMFIVVGLVVPYTIYGGFRSVTYTDAVQAIVMIVTLIAAPIAGIIYIADLPEGSIFAHSISDALNKAGDAYSTFTGGAVLKEGSPLSSALNNIFPNMEGIISGLGTGIIIAGAFSWFFGYLGGQPQLSMRFMAITDARQAKIARNK